MEIYCNYCGKLAEFVDSSVIYGRSYGMIYLCRPCDAYVGVHQGTNKPLGTLANSELREWRKLAHSYFDPTWKAKMKRDGCSKNEARRTGYEWLSKQLNIPFEQCHIGNFDIELCRKVIKVCTRSKS